MNVTTLAQINPNETAAMARTQRSIADLLAPLERQEIGRAHV